MRHQRGLKISARSYELARKKFVEMIRGENHPLYGVHTKLMDETKRKISESLQGKAPYEMTDKIRQKISESLMGDKNPNFGKHRSLQHCKRISQALLSSTKHKKAREKMKKIVLQYSKDG